MVEGVPQSDFGESQKSRAISGEMLGNAEGRTKEAREQTQQARKPTNTENFRPARQICTVNCFIMVIHPPPEAVAKNDVFQ